jgi:hypothetical protein
MNIVSDRAAIAHLDRLYGLFDSIPGGLENVTLHYDNNAGVNDDDDGAVDIKYVGWRSALKFDELPFNKNLLTSMILR